MYQHILLATDLTETCSVVNKKAKQLADQQGAKLTLIHTIEPIPAYGYPGVTDLESPLIDAAKKSLTELAHTMGLAEGACRVEFGSVKVQVLKVADELAVDLIIIGSHGRHGLSRLLGSSAGGIVHGAKCDVLTIRCTEN